MVSFLCRHCGSPDIDAEERGPRFIAVLIDGLDAHGDLDWRYDPSNRDDTEWEGSKAIGFRCACCDEAAEELVISSRRRRREGRVATCGVG